MMEREGWEGEGTTQWVKCMGLIRDGTMCEWGIRDLPYGYVGLCLWGC